MKTLIAAALVLTAGVAQANSFDHEKQIAYQIAVDTPDLFPTLDSAGETSVSGERTVFEYQLNIGSSELDPSLS